MIDYKLELIRQSPIDYNGLIINQISFADICDKIGLKTFDEILFPFTLTKECIKQNDDNSDFSLFGDVIIRDSQLLLSVATAFKLFCNCKDISKSEKSLVLDFEHTSFVVNDNNFDEISEILLTISGKEKIKFEKPPKNMSDRQRDVWEKLQEGRRKEAQKNCIYIYDVLNICEFGGNYHIPIDEIEKWTIWRIKNCYKARVDLKTYDDSLKICLVSGDGKSISDKNHWHHKLMIRDE